MTPVSYLVKVTSTQGEVTTESVLQKTLSWSAGNYRLGSKCVHEIESRECRGYRVINPGPIPRDLRSVDQADLVVLARMAEKYHVVQITKDDVVTPIDVVEERHPAITVATRTAAVGKQVFLDLSA